VVSVCDRSSEKIITSIW